MTLWQHQRESYRPRKVERSDDNHFAGVAVLIALMLCLPFIAAIGG